MNKTRSPPTKTKNKIKESHLMFIKYLEAIQIKKVWIIIWAIIKIDELLIIKNRELDVNTENNRIKVI